MLRIKERITADTFVVDVRDQIDADDLHTITPELERAIKANKKINLVYDVKHPQGITSEALFEDILKSLQHFMDIERIAVLHSFEFNSELPFAHTFTPVVVRNFPRAAYKEACRWAADDQSLFVEPHAQAAVM